MPTKRTRRSRGRMALTLESFSGRDVLSLLAGWHPPRVGFEGSRSRWQAWGDYFADADALELELLTHAWRKPGELPFAFAIREEMRSHPGEVYEAHSHKALSHVHFYRRGDHHVHDDGLDLGPAVEAGRCS